MNKREVIEQNGVVAILRGINQAHVLDIANALLEGGVRTIEVTIGTPKVISMIETLSDALGDQMMIGAGSVLDPETARIAILAGARFIFSPTVHRGTIEMAKRYGVVSIPGAMTPTEIVTAYEAGADIVKVFPARAVGPAYFKDVKGPMPHIPLMPTGGIDVANSEDYLKAGAIALGVGSSLVETKDGVTPQSLERITERARLFMEVIRKHRTTPNARIEQNV